MELVERDEALSRVAPGSQVLANYCCGTPITLLEGLARRARDVPGIVLTAGLMLGDPPLDDVVRSGRLALRSWHIHGALRELVREGLVDYLPLRLSDFAPAVLPDIDVVLVRVAPPDAEGWCNLGPSATFAPAAVAAVPLVIAEVDEAIPRTTGETRVRATDIDVFVSSEHPMPEYRPAVPDAVSRSIAERVLELVPEGATLQLGIGAIPEALAPLLADRAGDSGWGLVGLVTEAMMPLVDAIAAAGRGPVVAIELMGGPALMRWADGNSALEMRGSGTLHDPRWLAGIPTLISINSAVAVDLKGQVVAESVAGHLLAGVGGSADFAEGAHLSPGGLRVIALAATTARGESRIVAAHDPRDAITGPHHSVDVVVTEHGVAWLRGRTRSERADALRAIAAPEHRTVLADPDDRRTT
ncbi:MAG: acetyl-CoA hydrolase/transferase C-terminal domain-containing protein [Protaetiibacter sp.]